MKSTMLDKNSLTDLLNNLSPDKIQQAVMSLPEREAEVLLYDWALWARPSQLPPDSDWYIWLLLSGRGFGKTRTGAELVCKWAKDFSPIALIGQTKADVRDTMVEVGDSSILKISPPWFRPVYEPSKRRLTWPNGTLGIVYSGDEPDQLRGPQHAKAFVDELSKFRYPQETWDNLMMGLRIGAKPQVVVTTTPRPIPIIKSLVKDKQAVVTRGHTLENKANLATSTLKYILAKYEGTRLGRQELAGEILEDNPNALWKRDQIELLRVREAPEMKRVVVAIDPQAANTEDSAETGIIVAGLGMDGHGYILADATVKGSPDMWGKAAITAFHMLRADRIIGEVNNGGDMVEYVIRSIESNVPFKSVHASRGKIIRAEPVSALCEQGKIHHVGTFPDLEDQLCEWVPGEKSPDRLDALVWAITELMLDQEPIDQIVYFDTMTLIDERG